LLVERSIIHDIQDTYFLIYKGEPHFMKGKLAFFDVVDGYQAKGIAVPKDLQNVGLADECSLWDFIKSLFKGP